MKNLSKQFLEFVVKQTQYLKLAASVIAAPHNMSWHIQNVLRLSIKLLALRGGPALK